MEQQYVEIDLVELFKKIIRFWWLFAILVFISSGMSYYVTKNYITPIYEAKATVFIGKEQGALAEISLQQLQAGSRLVTDYRELIKTNQVLDGVIMSLGLDTTAKVLREKISVTIVNDSRFIYVSVQDPSPEIAKAIADQVSAILKEKAEEIIGAKNVYIVDEALVPEEAISPSTTKNVAIAGLLGIGMGVALIFFNMMLSNTIEKEEEIEKLIGVPVIGVIPKFKGDPR